MKSGVMLELRSSRGEIKIYEILKDNDLNFVEEYSFAGLNSSNGRPLRQRFDFAVFDDDNNLDFLIEYQGKQHYQASQKFGGKKGLYQQQFNDNKKRRFCALHGITLIEIPYTEYEQVTYDYIMHRAGY